jgi:hypothetical protein
VPFSNLDDQIKEPIRFNTEIIKIFSCLFVATGGGVASLLIKGLSNGREAVIAAFGIIFVIVIAIFGLLTYLNTKKLSR